jgi:hypothetical protein
MITDVSQLLQHMFFVPVRSGVPTFSKSTNHFKILDTRKGDMKQIPYWEPHNIRHHRTKLSLPGDVASGICAPLC